MPSVLTMNLRFGLAADGPNGWHHRKDCFPSFFEKYRKDFIGLQEANDFQTEFIDNGRKLIFVNTHFDFDASVQLESAKIILRRLAQLPSELPAIIVGDFNSTPSSPSHMIFTGEDVQLKSEDIKGPFFKNTFGKPFPGTHHGFTGDTNGDHIDWILYRGGIVPENCKVMHDTFDGVYISDHFPLCASFKWK
jgi:endonuclease/exonuclease/phosphatase family metal-dependent hydrolase